MLWFRRVINLLRVAAHGLIKLRDSKLALHMKPAFMKRLAADLIQTFDRYAQALLVVEHTAAVIPGAVAMITNESLLDLNRSLARLVGAVPPP